MIEFEKHINPANKFYLAIGYFALVNEGQDLVLYDEMGNTYTMDKVTLLSELYSSDNANSGIPDPFVISTDGEILETGSKLLLLSPFGKQNPIVLGALNPLGQQEGVRKELRLSKANLQRKTQKRTAGKTLYNTTFDVGGVSHSLTNGSFSIDADNAITFISEKVAHIIGKERLEALGAIVEIGGTDKVQENPIDYKANVINLLGKKVYVGHSQERIQELTVDQTNDVALNDPRLQNMVMGQALSRLLEVLIDELFDAIYLGAGSPVRMSETSKIKIRAKVKSKIPNILSEAGLLVRNESVIKNRN